jgi:hypothetical protein
VAPPSGLTVGLVAATEGAPSSGVVATFTSVDPSAMASGFLATIVWGDGTSSAGAILEDASGTFHVSGARTYAEEGSYTTSVTVQAVGGGSATAGGTAVVADAPLEAFGLPVVATRGALFSGQVATFADANPSATVADFSATIAWGDGQTSTGTIVADGERFVVSGSHAYDNWGPFAVAVTIQDTGVSTASTIGVAQVADAAPTVYPIAVSATEGQAFTANLAAFGATPGSPPIAVSTANYAAWIVWGDGSPATPGTIVAAPGGNVVTGTHVYADSGVDGGSGTVPVTVVL